MDPMQAATSSVQLQGELGVWISPGIGQAYPELKTILAKLRNDRIAKLPWLPVAWASQVQAVQDANTTALVRLYPARNLAGSANATIPAWLSSDGARMDAWQAIVKAQDAAIKQYAANDAANGKAELDRLQADAAFWNSPLMTAAINTQQALINAPSAIAGAAGTLVSDVFSGFLKKSWWVIGLVVVGYIVWTNRESVAKSAGKRIGKAIE